MARLGGLGGPSALPLRGRRRAAPAFLNPLHGFRSNLLSVPILPAIQSKTPQPVGGHRLRRFDLGMARLGGLGGPSALPLRGRRRAAPAFLNPLHGFRSNLLSVPILPAIQSKTPQPVGGHRLRRFDLGMARLGGFEPPTAWFVARYSIQLSYSRLKLMTKLIGGAAGRIRTSDRLVRSQVLYPAELQPHIDHLLWLNARSTCLTFP